MMRGRGFRVEQLKFLSFVFQFLALVYKYAVDKLSGIIS